MAEYFVTVRGKVMGPFQMAQLQSMSRQGLLKPTDRVSTDRSTWVPASQVGSLFASQAAHTTATVETNETVDTPLPPVRPPPLKRMPAAPPPTPGVFTIGRDSSCDLVVDTLSISKRHLALMTSLDGITATDLGSSTGSYVNGVRLTGPQLLNAGDTITLGGIPFDFDGRRVVRRQDNPGLLIRVRGLGREVTDNVTGQPRMLIRDVNATLLPGEFIALVGSSGAGKTTLFGALSGRVRATHGQVLYDGQDLYANFEAFRSSIGYVPQRDVFHDVLPVGEALRSISRLRLSKDTTDEEIEANIDRVLKIVSLTEKKNSIISTLSGGEQKRVSIAMELNCRPGVLFLDEPTAPLDPSTTTQMMQLFRQLADSGITVIMITHAASSLSFCDVIVYMHKGLLTFQGSPDRLQHFFGVADMKDAYDAEKTKSPDNWREQFTRSNEGREFVSGRLSRGSFKPNAAAQASSDAARRKKASLGSMIYQTRILTMLYFRVLTIDRKNLVLMLLLSPLVATLLCMITSYMDAKSNPILPEEWHQFQLKQNVLCFGSVMIVIFLALFNSVREIVKELPIYLREHFVNVEIIPYLLSKLIVLLAIDAVQAAMVVAVINLYGHIDAGTAWLQMGILTLCASVGTVTGLMISALVANPDPTVPLVRQTDQAVTGMIVVVIPQILFSSVFGELKGIPRIIAGSLITAYWGLNALMYEAMSKAPNVPGAQVFVEPADAFMVLGGQFLLLVGLIYWLMVQKDGPGAADRIAAKIKESVTGLRT